LVTSRALRLRREHPGWFTTGYAAVHATGPAAGHVIAFRRGGHAITVANRLPAGPRRRRGWAGTAPPPRGSRPRAPAGRGPRARRPPRRCPTLHYASPWRS